MTRTDSTMGSAADAAGVKSAAPHTPGPWRVAPPWSGFSEIRGADDVLVFGLAAGGDRERQPDDVCAANARLIAAAPDLLAALQAWMTHRSQVFAAHLANKPMPPSQRIDEILDQAKAAISKATRAEGAASAT
jgi:hypothetical protein